MTIAEQIDEKVRTLPDAPNALLWFILADRQPWGFRHDEVPETTRLILKS